MLNPEGRESNKAEVRDECTQRENTKVTINVVASVRNKFIMTEIGMTMDRLKLELTT